MQPLVDDGAAGVVDAGHDPFDPEGLAGDAGDEDVGVVAVGDRRQRVGPLDAALDEAVAVEADAHDGLAVEAGRQPTEGLLVAIDDGHGVVVIPEHARQPGPDPTTSDDDDMHELDLRRPRISAPRILTTTPSPPSHRRAGPRFPR